MSMEDILKVLVNSRQQGNSSAAADPMTELIGGLLGGGQPQTQNADSQQAGLGGMMGLLETVMGGGQDLGANDPIMGLLKPYVAPLAKKANISPEIAMVVISFVAHKLLAHHPTSGRDSNSFNFEDMFQQMGSGKIDSSILENSGMIQELSKKTGLDEATASKSLDMAFSLVGKGATNLINKNEGKPTAGKPTNPAGAKVNARVNRRAK